MSVPSKVIAPNIIDLINGDKDLIFFEGEARKIIDNTIRIYSRNHTISWIVFSVFGIVFLFIFLGFPIIGSMPLIRYLSLMLSFIFIFGGLSIRVSGNIKFQSHSNEYFRSVIDWKKFHDSKEGATMNAEPHGRLAVLMGMVASMDGWLYSEKIVKASTIRILVTIFFLLSLIQLMIYSLMNKSINPFLMDILICVSGILWGMVFIITELTYANSMYAKEQHYRRPRMMIYRAKLEDYWRKTSSC